jgi:hypothetical protein
MALVGWIEAFRDMHEKAKRGALAGRELSDYLSSRDELARALLAAQRVTIPSGLKPRRALRVARALQADLDFAVKAVRATTLDVSAAGFAALLPAPPRVGDEARVALRLPGGEVFKATARVAEAKALPGSARVAFTFVALRDEELERLERFVFDAVLAHMQA